MKKRNIFTMVLSILLCFNISYSQDAIFFPGAENYEQSYKIGYISAGAGFGMSWLNSEDITDWFEEDEKSMEHAAVFGSINSRLGITDIFQIEYRMGRDLGGHDILEYDFKYYYEDLTFKLNSLTFWKDRPEGLMIFLNYGIGRVNYLDIANDGWKGKSKLFGLEIFGIEKYKSYIGYFSFKISRSAIDFNQDILYGISVGSDFTGSQFIIELSFGFGFGY